MEYILGIDTGGTYTDSVLLDMQTKQILKTGKALTTPSDLIIGISSSIRSLGNIDSSSIKFVSLSTTLATNAVVENKGGKTLLILSGAESDCTYPAEETLCVGGRIDIKGRVIKTLSTESVISMLKSLDKSFDTVAISGYASARNPEHELLIKEAVENVFQTPSVCAHELTSTLGFYERTVTAVLNARLIPIINDWLDAMKKSLSEHSIDAPIMVMKGDGCLIHENAARKRPIETILSGPAASITGSLFLSNMENCDVIDIGGTTTDIAHVRNGQVDICSEGALVNNWRTRVRAADINTFGLGGDSRIDYVPSSVTIGPNKVTPLCRIKSSHPVLYEKMMHDKIISWSDDSIQTCLTPTDIFHAEKSFVYWDTILPSLALKLLADKYKYTEGQITDEIISELCRTLEANIDRNYPAVMVGAPAETWAEKLKETLGISAIVPEYSEVANAVGAAVGEIKEVVEGSIRYNNTNQMYIIFSACGRKAVPTLDEAKQILVQDLKKIASRRAADSKCSDIFFSKNINDKYVLCDSEREYMGTKITVTAVGKASWNSNRKKL